jgi:hypothetical protein
MSNPKALVLEGYNKYKDGYFRISTPQYEYVIVSDHDKINEFLGAPEDKLSFIDSSNEVCGFAECTGLKLQRTDALAGFPDSVDNG